MLSVSLDIPPDISVDDVRLLDALGLFQEQRVSAGKAGEIAGYSKATFIEVASKHGVAVFDFPPLDPERELTL